MNRTHIHFAPGLPKESGVISGMRASAQVYIYIDMEKALKGLIDNDLYLILKFIFRWSQILYLSQ